jgi:hypothetical protein
MFDEVYLWLSLLRKLLFYFLIVTELLGATLIFRKKLNIVLDALSCRMRIK